MAGRRLIYYVAASADGRIARPDGRVDWLDAMPAADYGGAEFVASVDTIVWGRKTFEQGEALGGLAPFGPTMRHLVMSRTHPAQQQGPVEFTNASATDVAKRLRAEPGRDVWIMGGADLAGSFLQAGELDDLIVHAIPVLLGDGIPLLRGLSRDVPLKLADAKTFPGGVVRLHYTLRNTAA